MSAQPAELLLKASSLEELGEVARDLGLTEALRAPMIEVLGPTPKAGRMVREVGKLAQALGTDDVQALLVDGGPLLAPRPMQGVKKKLFEHARTYLYEAARSEAEAQVEGPAVVQARTRVEAPETNPVAPQGFESQAAAAPSDADTTPGRPQTREALKNWARTHEVRGVLTQRLFSTLSDTDPQLFKQMVDPSVENAAFEDILFDPSLAGGSMRVQKRLTILKAAAWAHLEQCAEQTKVGLDEEKAKDWTVRNRPAAEVRNGLIDQLLKIRERVRLEVPPRASANQRAYEVVVEAGEQPAVVYTEAAESNFAFPLKVTLQLDVTGTIQVKSSHSGGDTDPYVLSALDEVLAWLFDETNDSLQPLFEALKHPAWLRGLMALEDAAAPSESQEDLLGELGWWVGLEPGLEIRPVVQKRMKNGTLARPKPVALPRVLAAHSGLDPLHVEVAQWVDLADVASRRSRDDALRLLGRALSRLAGRASVFFGDESTPGRLLQSPLGFVVDKEQDDLLMGVEIHGQRIEPEHFAAHRMGQGAGSLVFVRPDEDTLIFDVLSPGMLRAMAVLARYPRAMPTEAQGELVARLDALRQLGPVRFEASVPRAKVPAQPTLVVRLDGTPQGVMGRIWVRLIEGAPLVVPGEGVDEVVAARPDRTLVFAPRNLASERAWAMNQIQELFVGVAIGEDLDFELVGPEDVFGLLDGVRAAPGVEVEWAARPWRVTRTYTEDLKVAVKSRRDWFGLEGGVEVEGERVALAVLLEAIREGRRYVKLAEGDFVVLEQALVQRLAAVEPAARTVRDEIVVTVGAAQAVQDLGADAGSFEAAEAWHTAVSRMEAARDLQPVLPVELKATLRPYQLQGFEWMARLSTWGLGACLADDMGLGKTLQALSVLLYRQSEGPALVVAPTSVTFNWAREAARFAPTLQVRRYEGAKRAEQLEGLGAGHIVVTSYGLATRDAAELGKIEWSSLVLDEAQAVKNAQSQRSQAIQSLPAKWRLALSGTPVENRLSELWSLFAVIEPGLFGSWNEFKTRFAGPIERDGSELRSEALSRLIRPFVLRRTKRLVAPELPPRTDVEVDVVLSDAERALYEDVRLATLAKLEEGPSEAEPGEKGGGRFAVLAALTRLRQLACHPRLDNPKSEVEGSKLLRVMHLVRGLMASGQRALVFSQFTGHLALVRAAFEQEELSYLYLDGSTPTAVRQERVDAFQGGEAPLFLISLKAGGTGLNLTAADNVILLDPWWNPAVEDQATDRAHRIGQQNPVTVYRMVARNTVEDSILAMHAAKRALVGQVLDGTGAAGALGVDELVGLIRGG